MIQPFQGWPSPNLPRVGAGAPTLGYMIPTPLGLAKTLKKSPRSQISFGKALDEAIPLPIPTAMSEKIGAKWNFAGQRSQTKFGNEKWVGTAGTPVVDPPGER